MAEIDGVSGIEEVCAAFEQMPQRIAKVALAKALDAGVHPIMNAMAPRIPIGDKGELREALMYVVNISADGKGGVAEVGFGKMGWLARFIEFGTRHLGHKPKKLDLGKKIQPKPFMRVAVETAAQASVQAFADSLRESIDGGLL